MKSILICLVLLQFLTNLTLIKSQCANSLTCLHSGQFNTETCRCDCFPEYSGIYCETVNCSLQPSACGTSLTASQCSAQSIKDYCPLMCNSPGCTCVNGLDSCLNSGTFNSATCSCTCQSGFSGTACQTVSSCTPVTCQNSGTFNAATCSCDCFPYYSGNQCETLNCAVADNSYCLNFSQSDCNTLAIVQSYCPTRCGRCSTTQTTFSTSTTTSPMSTATTAPTSTTTTSTTSTSTTTSSTSTSTTSTSTTTSSTSTSTSSTSTSTASTSTPTTSTSFSTTSTRTSTPSTSSSTTSTSTTTSSTSTSTTSTSLMSTTTLAAGPVLVCQNGFSFNVGTRVCDCGTGFSGTLCETYDCCVNADVNADFCATGDCAELSGSDCPFTCNNCPPIPTPCTPPTITTTTSTTTTSTTTTTCTAVTCAFGLLNADTPCSCSCRTGFSGTLCETYDRCTSPTPDSLLGPLCLNIPCDTDSSLICPDKCLTTFAPCPN